MDIYDRILKDHETLRALLDRAQKGNGNAAAAFDELQRELWAHHKVEETVFYAAVADTREAGGEAREGRTEHHVLETLVGELATMEAGSDTWQAKLQVLGEILRHHLDEEEEELFEEAKEVLSGKRADELATAFDQRKRHALAALAPLES